MALRRLENSPYWIACFTLPDGRRTNRSTKTSDRRLAQRLADEWQSAADKSREGVLVEAQARQVLNEILACAGQEVLPSQTVEAYLGQWLRGKGEGRGARRYAGTVERFLESLGDKRHAQITAIGHQHILDFISEREEAGVAPKTLSVDLRILNAAFNVARKLALVLANPVERALALRPLESESSQRCCFSPDQVTALVGAAEGDWKTAILLGYFIGARLWDCCNLKWSNVDFVANVIEFVPQKTRRMGKRVVVPLHPNLAAHLEKLASTDCPEVFVCPSLVGKSTCGKNGLSEQFRRIMAEAGIEAQTVPGLGVRRFSKLSFHSLRHGFNSALANAGVSQETRMVLTGHRSVAVNAGYTHLELPKLRDAVEKLPRLA